ncbi:hypothetical protein GYMLUDRAFT_178075 [Collybiopsis luxurians FD-317 M1]|uniref:Glutaminase n=1 Tax=Collybiopsis luxurians FD-317 M1 TaxID=944289 RepID=A0A0D0BH12_9AGAR|nr:hypothetical protein GYMLUDRAFT_178075 [Collybiopsis luxurians FD-317 M1]
MFLWFFVLASSFFPLSLNQFIQSPAIPLAVRSPYIQAYLPHISTYTPTNAVQQWPNFWTTHHILGWGGLLRVDGLFYSWLGQYGGLTLDNNATLNAATLNSYQVTPTCSVLSLTAGAMAINITFLSPIEPDDLVLQSFPFTYIYFEASLMDGNFHSLQVYQDITGEWISSNITDFMQWNTTTSNTILFHQAWRSPPEPMTEAENMTEDGVVYHVTNAGNNVTYQTGAANPLREAFLSNGKLDNSQNTTSRAINDQFPVLAFSTDLGNITSTSSPVVWGIGLVRNPTIIYRNQTRRPYFFTRYPDVQNAMSDFISNASDARQRALKLDTKIISDSSKISPDYTGLVSLASRQVMAGLDITIGLDSNGQVNTSDILIFMKDIGNSQRINPVEVLYAALPAILYFNSSWAGYLLKPLLQFESSALYNVNFSAGDLGSNFPIAIGNRDPPIFEGMESTGDMLIMTWAHATFSGDGSLVSAYYHTLKKWTDWLISEHPLTPNEFTTADGLNRVNMTNLAIKGIIAIRSMAEISRVVGESDDYNNYSSTASSLALQWQSIAGSSGHLTSTYNDLSSWGLIYNLYPDKLLGFNLNPVNIINFTHKWFACIAPPFGLPFDSTEVTAMSHWTLFTAATVSDTNTRDSLVSMVHAAASNQKHFVVFPTRYSSSDGSLQGGAARYPMVLSSAISLYY